MTVINSPTMAIIPSFGFPAKSKNGLRALNGVLVCPLMQLSSTSPSKNFYNGHSTPHRKSQLPIRPPSWLLQNPSKGPLPPQRHFSSYRIFFFFCFFSCLLRLFNTLQFFALVILYYKKMS